MTNDYSRPTAVTPTGGRNSVAISSYSTMKIDYDIPDQPFQKPKPKLDNEKSALALNAQKKFEEEKGFNNSHFILIVLGIICILPYFGCFVYWCNK